MNEFPKTCLNKKIMNNISSLQNNYYKEDKNLGIHLSNNYSSLTNNKSKGNSLSKNKYRVVYCDHSIVDHNINNINKNIENKNYFNIITINNKNQNSSTGNIKQINLYTNFCKNKTNNSNNFYDKIVGDIISNKSKSKKKFSNKKKGPRSIYANKRPSMPLNKNKNKNNINIIKNEKIKDIKDDKKKLNLSNKKKLSSLSKLSFIKNQQNNFLINSNSSNNYNTYNNDSNKKNKNILSSNYMKNKLDLIKKQKEKEIKKCQSQSFFKKNNYDARKNKFQMSKSKNKSNNEISYKGIIMNRKNIMKNTITNSNSKKNRILCINYNKPSFKKNIINNSNFKFFMNNLPEEYNKNPTFIEIKNLWNKLKVTNTYQEMFITLTRNFDEKKNIFNHELSKLKKINILLSRLNTDIKKREKIIEKIKFYNIKNTEEMKKNLILLRSATIEVIYDFIFFYKEISYDILKNKFDINNINDFNKSYLNSIKEDTMFLYYNSDFNKNFCFSNKSDPFLIYPSIKKNRYIQVPIDEECLKKIAECKYFLLTEKISEYSLCDDNKAKINDLLFNDRDNIINNYINSNSDYKKKRNHSNYQNINIKIDQLAKTEESTNKYSKYCYMNTDVNTNDKKEINLDNFNTEKLISYSNNDKEYNHDNIENIYNHKNNESDKNESLFNNSNDYHSSPMKPPIKKNISIDNNKNITNNNNNNIVNINKNITTELIATPYIYSKEKSLLEIYKSYLTLVPDNIKNSFGINNDIYYYSNIGLYPKLIIFKNNLNDNDIQGICTISYNPIINSSQSFSKKILMITSISCIKNQKISEILKNLINFCDKNHILYDSIEVDLYYIKKEDGSYFLDKDLEKEIKSETKFKWVRLVNDGEKRKIKYHYIQKDMNKEIKSNNNINYINAIYMNNYVLIKFLEEKGINDITCLEYTNLYFVLNLLKKYYILNNNISENISSLDLENILSNLKGLKLKKIVRLISDFSNAIQTTNSNFREDYNMNNEFNIDYLNIFEDLINKNKTNDNDIIGFNMSNIITNFSNVVKTNIDNYEYNIISMNDFIIEVFNMKENSNNDLMFFTKSESDNISFILYEVNEINDNYDINKIFNKVLKKILVKDSEEPIKSYKKMCIPSFIYKNKNNKNEIKNKEDNNDLIKNEVLFEEENLEFCCENGINNEIKYSFGIDLNGNKDENMDIKIIRNNFILAVLNPDLVLDYHFPSMNIFYIDKSKWKKVNNNI